MNFEEYIEANLPKSDSFHPFFEEALREMLLAGGKRFRPNLLFSVVKAYRPLLLENSFSVAYAIELLHTYSLIHDDLPAMDNADLRRGVETLHKKYDEVTAILVGDALNTYSFYILSTAPLSADTKIKLIKELSSNGGIDGMIIGQAIDCYFENRKLDIDRVKFLHIHKTAKLIATSLKMGAIVADLSEELQNKLYEFGIKLGLIFQIEDDIIDATCNQEESGKTSGIDTNKNSFVNLMGLDKTIEERDRLLVELKNDSLNFNKKLSDALLSLIDKHNST